MPVHIPDFRPSTFVRSPVEILNHLNIEEEDLLQGPLADAMLHLGQIGIFRRMAGSPVAAENYVLAEISAGKLRKVDE
jgi:hypothetical protein